MAARASLAGAALFLMACVAPCHAQRVRGVVVSVDSIPLRTVDLRVLPDSIRTVTSDSGRFVLGPLQPGWHTIRFRRLGFLPVTVRLHTATRDTVLRVTMVSSIAILDTVQSHALAQSLPRVFARHRAHLGVMVYGDTLKRLLQREPGLKIEDLLKYDKHFGPLLIPVPWCVTLTFVDGKFVRGPIRFYVSTDDIAAVEFFTSPDFVHEPFLRPFKNRHGCFRFLLIWSKQFTQHPWGGG
jgi:hypothetical protein